MAANGQLLSDSRKEHVPSYVLPEDRWWNLLHYKIDITPDYQKKYISGHNSISFIAVDTGRVLQVNLKIYNW